MDGKEFPEDSLEFAVYMTRREFQLVYCFTFAAQAEDIVPPHVQMQGTLGVLFRWGIEYFQNICGYNFRGLRLNHDGTLYATVEEPLERSNVNWLQQLHLANQGLGGPPRYEIHLPIAIEYAIENVPDHGLVVEAMRSAYRQIQGVLAEIERTPPDEETRKAIREGLRLAMEEVKRMGEANGKAVH